MRSVAKGGINKLGRQQFQEKLIQGLREPSFCRGISTLPKSLRRWLPGAFRQCSTSLSRSISPPRNQTEVLTAGLVYQVITRPYQAAFHIPLLIHTKFVHLDSLSQNSKLPHAQETFVPWCLSSGTRDQSLPLSSLHFRPLPPPPPSPSGHSRI